jgi:hypothetical protein
MTLCIYRENQERPYKYHLNTFKHIKHHKDGYTTVLALQDGQDKVRQSRSLTRQDKAPASLPRQDKASISRLVLSGAHLWLYVGSPKRRIRLDTLVHPLHKILTKVDVE